jgi:hypothetical protein
MKTKVLFFIILIQNLAFSQKIEQTPAEISVFIPKGFEMLSLYKGDINNDKLVDYVLVCKSKKEGEDGGLPRPIFLILQDASKKYKVVKKSEKIIMCAGCGGMMGDPFSGIEINRDGTFSIQHYGGSSWRWSKDATFRFDNAKNNWVLTSEKTITFHASEPEKTTREYSIPENEFLAPKTFDTYTGEDEAPASNWKVKSEKAFFYNQADEKTIRKGFLVKGNKVETFVETKNFIWVEYPKTDEFKRGTLGFILKKDLEKVN